MTLGVWKSIAQWDFHILLCAFVVALLKINQMLDRLIIQLVWYIVTKTIIINLSVSKSNEYLPTLW